jgi:hypothetical protein
MAAHLRIQGLLPLDLRWIKNYRIKDSLVNLVEIIPTPKGLYRS